MSALTTVALDRDTAVAKLEKLQDPRLDKNDPDHVDAWLACRMKGQRVNANQVVAVLAQKKHMLSKAAQFRTTFIVVPKKMFPNGPHRKNKRAFPKRRGIEKLEDPVRRPRRRHQHVHSGRAVPQNVLGGPLGLR